MAARARLVLLGLAFSLVAGLAVLAWVAFRGGATPRAPSTGAADESAASPPAAVVADDAAGADARPDAVAADEGAEATAARRELGVEALDDLRPWRGRVVDADGGAGIAGAEVELAAGERVRAATSDAQGDFELAWPADLAARLSIRHPRYVDATAARADLSRDGRFALQRSAILRGSVLPAGDAGTVSVWLQNASSSRSWTQTDAPIAADGRFALEDLTPGEYLVAAFVEARAVAPESGLRLEPGEEFELALVAREGARVLGRATSEPSGAPLAGLFVTAEPRRDGVPQQWTAAARQQATSDAGGRFEFAGLIPGAWRIVARNERGANENRDLDVAASGELHEIEFAFPVASSLDGRVVDASGAGLAGCEVAALGWGGGATEFLEGKGSAQAVSDAQGWFRIVGVEPRSDLDVVARTPLEGAARPERFGLTSLPELAPGTNRTGVVVELRGAGSVAGRVTNTSGEPIAARVRAFARLNARNRISVETQADADGRFLIERVPSASGRIEARADGWRTTGTECSFDGGEVELELEPAHALEGWALDAQGLAVAGVQITVQPVAVNGNEREARRARRSTASDDAGRFRFEDLRPGPWEVRGGSYAWRLAGAVPRTVEIPAPDVIELLFEPEERPESATIEGEVALPDGGAPTGVALEGLRGGVLAVEHGRFRVTGVAPATWQLTLRADGHARVPLEPFQLAPGGTYDVGRVLLEPSTHLVVRVRAQGGGDLDGARVRLLPLPLEEGGAGPQARTLRLDATRRGRYETTDATRHAWRLVIERPGHKRHVQRLEVRAEERQSLEIELERQP